ncbi:MAG: putative sensory box sensor histidine kinase/response regulator [Bryobacterales bacterium]|nr:putative sensory box sensor histidine kinase/response regulator [Bryobacterales bacterium]
MLSFFIRGNPRAVLVRAGVLIVLIALADWRVDANIPLGFLYLFPMLLVGSVATRWQIAAVAAVCTLLTEFFDAFAWSPELGGPRDILVFAAFFCMGLFVYEATRSRRTSLQHLHRIESEVEARREAEEQLTVLVESSPAAILTMDGDGRILLANDAAHRLLAVESSTLRGKSVGDYLPALISVPARGDTHQAFRTVMQCRGRRQDGEVFLADVWFSTYRTGQGPRLAAMVVDTSEDLRNREEFSLHQLLAGSRILVGAVSHEIRNVCGAIAVVHANLARSGSLSGSKDFEALGTLILALEKIASMDLRQTANQASGIDLASLLEEFRIVVEPSLREDGIETHWDVEPDLPAVWADRQSLMQVFLNLIKNSERAMSGRPRPKLTITARREKQRVAIQFRDSGSGVANPDRLFRPFQQDAQATGLGLYLSRAFMRSFRGDLRHEPEQDGSSFIVEVAAVISSEQENNDPDTTGGRSRVVPGEPQPVAPGRT